MRKSSPLNLFMLILSVLGAIAAYILGEMLLLYVAYLPYWLQCGIYLLFVSGICCLVMFISEMIRPGGYLLKHRQEFKQTAGKAAMIMLPAALALGIVTQLLYGLIGMQKSEKPDFQGTMIVCDISGSMFENDPNQDAVKAITEYIDSVPLGEYLGVTLFNQMPNTIREYAVLKTEEERTELKDFISSNVVYEGNTDIQSALMASFAQMRLIEDKDWPGLVLLFSDGLSYMDYAQLQKASLGDVEDPKTSIPVNTIYYASTPLGGYQMSTIAQKTGGAYFYIGVDSDEIALRDVFTHSRSIFTGEKPHLLQPYYGVSRTSPLRIILQILFLAIWGIFTGVLVVVFLNNNKLIRHYLYAKIVVSFVFAVIFAVLMIASGADNRMTPMALLAAGMCITYVPTYTWDNMGVMDGTQSLYSAR